MTTLVHDTDEDSRPPSDEGSGGGTTSRGDVDAADQPPPQDRRLRAQRWTGSITWAIMCSIAYAALSLQRMSNFEVTSWDNAIFQQAVKSYASLGAPIVNIKGPGFNILGDHFSPVTALLAPAYWIWPSPKMLLVAQAILIGVSVAVITEVALRKLGPITGAAMAFCYAASFGIWAALRVDFHEVAFAAPLLALAGRAYLDRRWTQLMVWSSLLLFVKEDFGLTVVAIAAVLWLAKERKRAYILAAIGAIGAALVLLVIIPAFNPDGSYDYTSKIAGEKSTWEVFLTQLDTKTITLFISFAITGLAALWSPWALVAIPTFAWRFVGDTTYYWGMEFHYSLPIMPIVFIAAIDAMTRFKWLKFAAIPAVIMTALTFGPGVPPGAEASDQPFLKRIGGSPISDLIKVETWNKSDRARQVPEVIAAVPKGASVETDISLISHLVTDHRVYWIGSIGDAKPACVAFDHNLQLGSPENGMKYGAERYGGTWQQMYNKNGYEVSCRIK